MGPRRLHPWVTLTPNPPPSQHFLKNRRCNFRSNLFQKPKKIACWIFFLKKKILLDQDDEFGPKMGQKCHNFPTFHLFFFGTGEKMTYGTGFGPSKNNGMGGSSIHGSPRAPSMGHLHLQVSITPPRALPGPLGLCSSCKCLFIEGHPAKPSQKHCSIFPRARATESDQIWWSK